MESGPRRGPYSFHRKFWVSVHRRTLAFLNSTTSASVPGDGSFGSNCLLARRLIERGVRFIQVYHAGWDHHSNVEGGLKSQCKQTDQGCAALVKDLKRRGMLDETLVVWGGEFGRTPMAQGGDGRDHHINAFSVWMAGGGVRPGIASFMAPCFGAR